MPPQPLSAIVNAEPPPATPPPSSEPPPSLPETMRIDPEAFDAGDLEDIAEYAGRDDALLLVMSAALAEEPLSAVFSLPPKVFTAMLGTLARKIDPRWTPEHWRKIRLADFTSAIAGSDELDPTDAATPPGSTGGASGNETSTPTAPRNGAARGSARTRR